MPEMQFSKKCTRIKNPDLSNTYNVQRHFLQFGGEEQAYDLFMDIGEYFQGFQEGIVAFASSIFGIFGF